MLYFYGFPLHKYVYIDNIIWSCTHGCWYQHLRSAHRKTKTKSLHKNKTASDTRAWQQRTRFARENPL